MLNLSTKVALTEEHRNMRCEEKRQEGYETCLGKKTRIRRASAGSLPSLPSLPFMSSIRSAGMHAVSSMYTRESDLRGREEERGEKRVQA